MKRLTIKALCWLLTLCTLVGVIASCTPAEPEPKEREILYTEGTELNENGEYVTQIYSDEHDFSNTTKDTVSVKYTYEETEYSATLKDVTVIDKNTLEVTFINEKEDERPAELYKIYIEDPYAVADVYAILPEANVSLNVESIYAYDNSFRLTLELEEGTYASNFSKDCITLGGSFKDFTIDSLSASGKNLTMQLSGSMERNPSAGFFVDGTIDIDSSAFADKLEGITVNVPVVSEPVRFVSDSLKVNGGTVTADLAVNDGALLEGMKAEDIIFENGVTVTDLVKEDGIATLTMAVGGAESANAAANILNGQTVTIGETEFIAEFNAPMFYPVFDYVEENGNNLDFTLILYATYGKFNKLTTDMITLGDDFAGGTVTSLEKDGDYTAELIISVPAQGQSVEALDMDGSLSLAAGAMQSLWNTSSEALSHIRNYSQESMGKDTFDDWFLSFASADYDFTNVKVVSSGSNVKDYFKKVIEVFKGETFSTVIGVASGVASAASGVYTLLQVLGVVDSPTSLIREAIDLMKEEFAEIQNKLDTITRQDYYNKIFDFYEDLYELGYYEQAMKTRIQRIARNYKIEMPKAPNPATATEEETNAYNAAMDAYYKEIIPILMEDDDDIFNQLRRSYVTVTSKFCSGSKPILETFDELMSMLYAFDNEAFEARDNFRTLAMMQIVNAVGTMSLYYKYFYDEPMTDSFETEVMRVYRKTCDIFEKYALEGEDDKIYCYVTNDYYDRQMVIQGISYYPVTKSKKAVGYAYAVMDPSCMTHPTDNRKGNVKASVSYIAQIYDTKIAVDGTIYTDFEVGDKFTGSKMKVKRTDGVIETYSFDSVSITTANKGKNISKSNAKEIAKRFKAQYGSSINMVTILSKIGFVVPAGVKTAGKSKSIAGILYNVDRYTTVDYLKTNGKIVSNKDVWGYGEVANEQENGDKKYTKKSTMLISFVGASDD